MAIGRCFRLRMRTLNALVYR